MTRHTINLTRTAWSGAELDPDRNNDVQKIRPSIMQIDNPFIPSHIHMWAGQSPLSIDMYRRVDWCIPKQLRSLNPSSQIRLTDRNVDALGASIKNANYPLLIPESISTSLLH